MVKKELEKRFLYAFKINKMIIFEVEYGAITSNEEGHFSTSASKFIKNKKDWEICGQAQNDLLKDGTTAKKFWEKWDAKHLKKLNTREYKELLKDIEKLKEKYKYIYKDKNYDRHYISFYELKELSMKK